MESTRQKLINIIKGGDGRVEDWIERVTFRRPGHEDQVGYILHLVAGGLTFEVPFTSLEAAYGLSHALSTGAQPADHELNDEERAARIASLPPPEDNGRVIESSVEVLD